ncbi:MAG: hypothetical protein CFE35_21795 [Novosphingobium sp. PASSN1]|nr:MAG: hypothetical protein CFE35_21795 [Novosphingobium sp. PASSN1]
MPWQTILADLAMILFMMTAAALANAPDGPLLPSTVKPAPHAAAPALRPIAASPRAEPVGVWRDDPGAPALATWLAQQARDPRLRVSILVRHGLGHERAALARAETLMTAAGARGAGARIVIEPGQADGASVVLAYDAE